MNRQLLALVTAYILIILLFAYMRPTPTDWTPTYAPDRNSPFASRILYEELPTIRSEHIRTTDRPVYNTIREIDPDQHGIYFLVSRYFEPSDLDLKALLSYVSEGNTVFIGSQYFSTNLMDTLDLSIHHSYSPALNPAEWFYEDNVQLTLVGDTVQWPAAARSGYSWFASSDSSQLDTLGLIDAAYPDYIHCRFGNGHFYLHTFPYVFTNYHMLYRNNHQYISRALGMIPAADIWIWDTYYSVGANRASQNPFAAMVKYESFRWAYWIAVVSAILFILFTAKRRQRVIPVVRPKRNTTLDFIRTIGDLYFHRADHTDLVRKKISLLKAHLMKKYRTTVETFSDEEAKHVLLRSEIAPETVYGLFRHIRQLQTQRDVTVTSLWTLQSDLDRFYGRTAQAISPLSNKSILSDKQL